MVEYDTRMGFRETGGMCQEIADEYPNLLSMLWENTARSGEEQGVGIWKEEDGTMGATDITGSTSMSGKSAMSAQDISDIKVGINDKIKSDEPADWKAIVHTHPGGDPSLSGKDISYILDFALSHTGWTPEGTKQTKWALLAVSKDSSGDIIITGYRVADEVPDFDIIEFYIKQADKWARRGAVTYYESYQEGKKEYTDKWEAYEKLQKLVEEGHLDKEGALERCHAVIKGEGRNA